MTSPNEEHGCLIAADVLGSGEDALLLPALSSISTRDELRPLATLLADRFRCIIPDWPGFGTRASEAADLTPAGLRGFLDTFISNAIRPPAVGIAAGHAAPYLVAAAEQRPGIFRHLVLIAPTWRGPMPTMLGDSRRPLTRQIRRVIEMPVVGTGLFRLNVSRPVVARMMRAHVYANPDTATTERVDRKVAMTRQPRSRFATAAFISGGLDPVLSRAAFLDLFKGALPPVLLLRPESAPPRSAAEMDALAETKIVTTVRVPGALAAHEEFPHAVAAEVRAALLPN